MCNRLDDTSWRGDGGPGRVRVPVWRTTDQTQTHTQPTRALHQLVVCLPVLVQQQAGVSVRPSLRLKKISICGSIHIFVSIIYQTKLTALNISVIRKKVKGFINQVGDKLILAEVIVTMQVILICNTIPLLISQSLPVRHRQLIHEQLIVIDSGNVNLKYEY